MTAILGVLGVVLLVGAGIWCRLVVNEIQRARHTAEVAGRASEAECQRLTTRLADALSTLATLQMQVVALEQARQAATEVARIESERARTDRQDVEAAAQQAAEQSQARIHALEQARVDEQLASEQAMRRATAECDRHELEAQQAAAELAQCRARVDDLEQAQMAAQIAAAEVARMDAVESDRRALAAQQAAAELAEHRARVEACGRAAWTQLGLNPDEYRRSASLKNRGKTHEFAHLLALDLQQPDALDTVGQVLDLMTGAR